MTATNHNQSNASARDSHSQGGDETIQHAADLPQIEGYQIIGLLGRGAMGTVYEAIQLKLHRTVALKILSHEEKREHVVRFQTEAESVAKIHHPNIVQVYEINDHDGKPFITLELIDGGDLEERLKGQPLPLTEAVELIKTTARGIDAAHKAGVIHRDLKPSNIMLTKEGIPKVTDFGLAKHLEASSSQTQAGEILGTPHYMSPEQALGKSDQIGPSCDIYSLGVILYEMLTGVLPSKGESVLETLELVRTKDPDPLRKHVPSLPRDLETICLKCLQKKPRHRYATAGELADDLEAFLAGEPVSARAISASEKSLRWIQKNLVISGLVASIILLLPMLMFALGRAEKEAEENAELREQKAFILNTPMGLPPVPIPSNNPLTEAKVSLGHQLFFDTRLSAHDNISCASCHHPQKGWADGLARSEGSGGTKLRRNSPSIVNASYFRFLFWDGRAESMELQATQPITHPDEMGMPDLDAVAGKLNKIPEYRKQFEEVFQRPASGEDIGKALAAFERTLMSGHTVFDCADGGHCHHYSPAALRGKELFMNKAQCNKCHSGPLFTDDQFHNIGVGYHLDPQGNLTGPDDKGRFEFTNDEFDLGAFKTPSLRDVDRTAPYMHDGSQATLEEVVDFYDLGGIKNPNLDQRIRPLHLTPQEKEDLVTFLKEGLTSVDYPTVRRPQLP